MLALTPLHRQRSFRNASLLSPLCWKSSLREQKEYHFKQYFIDLLQHSPASDKRNRGENACGQWNQAKNVWKFGHCVLYVPVSTIRTETCLGPCSCHSSGLDSFPSHWLCPTVLHKAFSAHVSPKKLLVTVLILWIHCSSVYILFPPRYKAFWVLKSYFWTQQSALVLGLRSGQNTWHNHVLIIKPQVSCSSCFKAWLSHLSVRQQ